jgi:hypothetical protein
VVLIGLGILILHHAGTIGWLLRHTSHQGGVVSFDAGAAKFSNPERSENHAAVNV